MGKGTRPKKVKEDKQCMITWRVIGSFYNRVIEGAELTEESINQFITQAVRERLHKLRKQQEEQK